MKLYMTETSAYARMVRVVILEKELQHRVETIIAETRTVDSPYYKINPSGRVPYLVLDDGTGIEESAFICSVLDQLEGQPVFESPTGKQGLEVRRLEALACALGLEARNPDLDWRSGRPQLCEWFDQIAARPSFFCDGPAEDTDRIAHRYAMI